MKFLMLIKLQESYRKQQLPQALMEAMDVFVTEKMKSGAVIDTAGLRPSADGFRIRLAGGSLRVTDGPFVETKEVIGGYAMAELNSRDEALALAREFMDLHRIHWPAFEGECEVRPLEAM